MSRNLEVVSSRLVGVNNQHIRLYTRQNGADFDVIGFNLADKFELVNKPGSVIDMVYTIEKNEWMNRVTTQLNAKDIR